MKDKAKLNIVALILILLLTISSYTYYIYNYTCMSKPISYSDLGGIGDFFGGLLSPFFTFITLVYIIFTFNDQRRESLKNKKDLETMNATNTFFQLFSLNKQSSLKVDNNFFKECFDIFKDKSDDSSLDIKKNSKECMSLVIKEKDIDYFFNEIIFLVNYVNNSPTFTKNKSLRDNYIKIISNELSYYERIMLFYYYMTMDKSKKINNTSFYKIFDVIHEEDYIYKSKDVAFLNSLA